MPKTEVGKKKFHVKFEVFSPALSMSVPFNLDIDAYTRKSAISQAKIANKAVTGGAKMDKLVVEEVGGGVMPLTVKQRALAKAKELGCAVETLNEPRSPYPDCPNPKLEVFAPDGMEFSPDGVSSMLCLSWEDMIERLSHATLQPETGVN